MKDEKTADFIHAADGRVVPELPRGIKSTTEPQVPRKNLRTLFGRALSQFLKRLDGRLAFEASGSSISNAGLSNRMAKTIRPRGQRERKSGPAGYLEWLEQSA